MRRRQRLPSGPRADSAASRSRSRITAVPSSGGWASGAGEGIQSKPWGCRGGEEKDRGAAAGGGAGERKGWGRQGRGGSGGVAGREFWRPFEGDDMAVCVAPQGWRVVA